MSNQKDDVPEATLMSRIAHAIKECDARTLESLLPEIQTILNVMRAGRGESPERVWITWDDAYPWPTPETGGNEYVRADLLTTIRQEERRAAFKDAVDAVRAKAKYLGQSDRQVAAQQVNGCLRAIDAIEAAANETRKDATNG